MRLVHIGSGHAFGGIERMLLALAGVVEEQRASFALMFEGRLAAELRELGADVMIVGPVRASRPLSVIAARARLRAELAHRATNAVVCHGPWSHAIAAPAVRASGARLGFFAHAAARPWHWTDRWAALHVPDVVLANSRYTASRLRGLVAASAAAIVHPTVQSSAVPENARARVRAELGADDSEVVVLCVARIESGKGQLQLIHALAHLATGARWRCWIVGGASSAQALRYRASLADAIRAAALDDRVQLLGERADIPALLAAADVFCHPHIHAESFGLAPAEALAAGLPVVASDAGGVAEALAGGGATLVPPGNVSALTEALRVLLDNPQRRQRRIPLDTLGAARRAAARIVEALSVPGALPAPGHAGRSELEKPA